MTIVRKQIGLGLAQTFIVCSFPALFLFAAWHSEALRRSLVILEPRIPPCLVILALGLLALKFIQSRSPSGKAAQHPPPPPRSWWVQPLLLSACIVA